MNSTLLMILNKHWNNKNILIKKEGKKEIAEDRVRVQIQEQNRIVIWSLLFLYSLCHKA